MTGLGDVRALVREARLIITAELSADAGAVLYVTRTSDPDADRDRSELWVRRLDADRAERVDAPGASVTAARWSPAGDRIAVARDDVDGARVDVVEPRSTDTPAGASRCARSATPYRRQSARPSVARSLIRSASLASR